MVFATKVHFGTKLVPMSTQLNSGEISSIGSVESKKLFFFNVEYTSGDFGIVFLLTNTAM